MFKPYLALTIALLILALARAAHLDVLPSTAVHITAQTPVCEAECTQGYTWALEHAVTDEVQCKGSDAYIDGCKRLIREADEQRQSDFEGV